MPKKCNYKFKGKCFKTKQAKENYKSWTPIIKQAVKNKEKKSTIKMINDFQKGWIGK